MALKRRLRKYSSLYLAMMIAVGFCSVSFAQANPNPVDQADNLVKQWLNLSQQQSALQTLWLSKEPALKQRLTLLQQEQQQLDSLIIENQHQGSEVEQQRAELLTLQTNMEANQQLLSQWLTTQFTKVHNIIDRLPPPLALQWQKTLSENSIDEANNSDKLTLLLGLFSKLSDFDNRIASFESTIIDIEQQSRLVKQLYLGISRGWYLSMDGESVFEGVATDQGWKWQHNSSLDPKELNNAIAMVEQRKEASFIRLPLSLNANDSLLKLETNHE